MPRGVRKFAELAGEARRLRDEDGLNGVEIAGRLGISKSTVYEWLNDPDRSAARARRGRYAGKCERCGAPTDGSKGFRPSSHCKACSPIVGRKWTEETIVAAIQLWAEQHDGEPPKARVWLHEVAGQGWPGVNVVQVRFGSWNAGLRAAGFEPREPGRYGRDGESPELCAEIRRRYEAGESTSRLAREYGCDPGAILYRVRSAGGEIVFRPPVRRRLAIGGGWVTEGDEDENAG